MFIPNKTVQLIKTSAIVLLVLLVMIIAMQSVLYIKMSTDTKTQTSKFQSELDSLKVSGELFENNSWLKHKATEKDLSVTQRHLDSLHNQVTSLQQSINTVLFKTDILVENACDVRPYYTDKRLLEMCK
jgi:uncharacterized protein HemX